MAIVYRRHLQEKQLKYEEKVREVEHASFVPFVLPCTGGAGPGATGTMKRLAAIAGRKVSITLQFHHSVRPLPPQLRSTKVITDVSLRFQVISMASRKH